MAHAQQKKSEKLYVIDHETFEKIQQQSSAQTYNKTIRNSKYKRTHGGGERCAFNLLNFVKKPKTTKLKNLRRKFNTLKVSMVKRRGKTREGGHKKKYTRLKKAILRYRLHKEKLQTKQINEVTHNLESLNLRPQEENLEKQVAALSITNSLHSRRFRSYCDNSTTTELAEHTEHLLRELDRFQKRAYAHNEIKARAHRRIIVGFREVQNFLRINKVKLVLIAPDCESSMGEGGLDETISAIKQQCQSQNIPYAFSLRRRQLAYALFKKVPVSCIGILNYDGARDIFVELLNALQEAKLRYTQIASVPLPNT